MKKKRKKLYVILICCVLLCIIGIGSGYIYKKKNSTSNVLVESIYNMVENSEDNLDEEFLISYNKENKEKLNSGKDLSFEEYFLIAYEYCALNMEREEGIKYAYMARDKKNIFTNRFAELYNEYLINYADMFLNHDESVLEKIDESFNDVTVSEWNKYYNLLLSHISVSLNFNDGTEYMIEKIEDLMDNEDKLNSSKRIDLKSWLITMYIQNGHYAKALETCLEAETLLDLDTGSIDKKDYYEAVFKSYKGAVYHLLHDSKTAINIYEEVFNYEIEDEALNIDNKIRALTNLITIYLEQGNFDEMGNLLNKCNELIEKGYSDHLEIYYNMCMAGYYIGKFQKESEDLREYNLGQVKYYIQLVQDELSDLNGRIVVGSFEVLETFIYYLQYMEGDVEGALENYHKLLETTSDSMIKRSAVNRLDNIYYRENRYKEAYECSKKNVEIMDEESLLINKDYSAYSVEKYENELELRRLNDEKLHNYIKAFILILVTSISIIIMIMKNRNLRIKNITDGLTGAYNRTHFNEIFNKKIQKNKDFYLFIFDIDNFKKVNDTYGHLVGDEVLIRIAKTAKEIVGNSGDLFRYGGEEFVVLANPKDKITIINLADKIRKGVEDLVWDNGMKTTISVGVADSKIEKENVLEVADKRLYTSKTTGKNKVTWHDESFMKIG